MQCMQLMVYTNVPRGWSMFSPTWLDAAHVDAEPVTTGLQRTVDTPDDHTGLRLIMDRVERRDEVERSRLVERGDVLHLE